MLGTNSIKVAIKSGKVGHIILSCAVMSHDKPFMMIHLCFQTWRTLYNVLNNDRLESLSPQNTKRPLKGGEASTIEDLDEADKLLTQPHYKG